MITMTASNARKELYRLIDKIAEFHKPIVVIGKRNNVVMLPEKDWRAIEETLYLNSIPGLTKELIERGEAKDSDFIDEEDMDW